MPESDAGQHGLEHFHRDRAGPQDGGDGRGEVDDGALDTDRRGSSVDDQIDPAIEILEENFGDRVFAARIRKTVRFAEAPVKGMSVLKYDPDGKAAFAYRELAKEVLANGQR